MMHSYETARPSHTPRLDSSIRLADGRRLAYAEWGPPDGQPVLFLHGSAGSRLLCPDSEATSAAGVRFVSFDRAGYGASDPARSLLHCADVVPDMVELIDHIGIDKVAVAGWSGGGPYALAFGALAPDRVTTIGVLCSLGEHASEVGASSELLDLQRQVADNPVTHREAVRRRCQWLAEDPDQPLRLTERFDPAVLTAPGMRETFQAWMLEAGRNGLDGYVDDWIADVCPRGFELGQVLGPVVSWFGEQDQVVPRHHADFLAANLPQCASVACPECGHFLPFAHWPEVLDQLTHP